MKPSPRETEPPNDGSASTEHLAEISALAAVIWRAHYPGIITPAQIDYMLARMYDVDTMLRCELDERRGVVPRAGRWRHCAASPPSAPGADFATEFKLHKLYVHPRLATPRTRQRAAEGVRVRRPRPRRDHAHAERQQAQRNVALAAYRRRGFAIRESIVVDIGGGFVMDDYVMVKRL